MHYLSAVEAIARFRARTLSPVELLEAVIARRAAVEPAINAFTFTFDDAARAAAREAEARYAAGTARPLEGIALVVKDLHPIAGHITTHGSRVFRHNRDETTLTTVQRLLDAGAILIARSTSSEFGLVNVTHTRLWGTTRNPWNLAYTPGGSSGGAGAALAAGTTTLADGSDYGGSIRIPAACCGVVGYKPPHGRNPSDSLDPCSHFGPLARTVADCALMQNVMTGPSDTDLDSLPGVTLPDTFAPIRGFRVAWSLDLGFATIDPEVATAFRGFLGLLEALGCALEPVRLGWTDRVREAFQLHHDAADAAVLWMLLPSQREELCDYSLAAIERGNAIRGRDVFTVNEVRAEMYAELGPILSRCDLFACPTTCVPAIAAEGPADHRWILTYPFNLLGVLPVLSVPIARAASGVPIGVQLVGRPRDDLAVFRAGAAIEAARGPWFTDAATTPAIGDNKRDCSSSQSRESHRDRS